MWWPTKSTLPTIQKKLDDNFIFVPQRIWTQLDKLVPTLCLTSSQPLYSPRCYFSARVTLRVAIRWVLESTWHQNEAAVHCQTNWTYKNYECRNYKGAPCYTLSGQVKRSPRRGIEPRSPAWQAGILATILPRIGTCYLMLVESAHCLYTLCKF